MIEQLVFIVCLAVTIFFATKSVKRIIRNIKLGKDIDLTGNKLERIKKVFLIALGQKKMFSRPIPAILHLFIYVGFLIVNIEMLEIVLDGVLGTHRLFAVSLGVFYTFMLNVFEFFAISVIVVCIVFLIRRNVLNIGRFHKPELKKWPLLDANVILFAEIALMFAFLNMNAIDQVLQAKGNPHFHATGNLFFSSLFMPLYGNASDGGLVIAERFYWWAHILGIFLFANYLPYSKHLHIILAFPNTYFSKLNAVGEISSMPEVTKEVKLMLNLPVENSLPSTEPLRFGAKDATDLTWKNLLDAYSCTECGRCTSVCPANLTGKVLSPRKIMMDTRDRVEEIGNNIDKNGAFVEDGKALYSDEYISKEELLACTTCNACVEECPININPLDIIVQLRRYMVMEESKAPGQWNNMFSNLENNFAPWKFAPSDRFNWADKLND